MAVVQSAQLWYTCYDIVTGGYRSENSEFRQKDDREMKKKKGYGLFGTNKRKPAKKVDKYTEEYYEEYDDEEYDTEYYSDEEDGAYYEDGNYAVEEYDESEEYVEEYEDSYE